MRWAVVCLGLFLGGWGVHAQPAPTFDYVGVEQGLSQRQVFALAQDHDGFLWFGTNDGLNRYDGHRFKVYRHRLDDPTALASSRISALRVTRAGVLWVGTPAGLHRFDRATETFVRPATAPGLPDSPCGAFVTSIAEDERGVLWVSTREGRSPCYLESGATRFQHHPVVPDAAALGSNLVFQQPEGGPVFFSQHLADDRTMMCLLDAEARTCAQRLVREGSIFGLATMPDGPHYVLRGSPQSLEFDVVRWDADGRETPLGISAQGLMAQWITAYVRSATRLWVPTATHGLVEIDMARRTATYLVLPSARPGDPPEQLVYSLLEDRQGAVWVGTASGLRVWRPTVPRAFQVTQHQPGLPGTLSDNRVNRLFVDRQNGLWVATNNGLNRRDPVTGRFRVYQLPYQDGYENAFWWMTQDRKGTYWVGTKREGLFTLDAATGRFTPVLSGQQGYLRDLLQEGGIRYVGEDSAGRLWIGTSLGLIQRSPRGQFRLHQGDATQPDSLPSSLVNIVYEDQRGTLWVGTDGGLCRFDVAATRFSCLTNRPGDIGSLGADVIWTLAETPRTPGLLWVGTIGGGLCALDPATDTCTRFTTDDGLPNNTVYGLLADGRGNLWATTNDGLVRLDPVSRLVRVFRTNEGLPANEFDLMAYTQGPTGHLYVGGRNGFVSFHPDSLRASTYRPPIVFTGLRVYDQERPGLLQPGATLRLAHDENFFRLDFAALDYSQPQATRFRYRLRGYDAEWRATTGERPEASYTGVPPGRYVFEVQGSNADGLFNPEPLVLNVEVVPRVWQTLWFRVLALVGAVGALAALARQRLRRRSVRQAAREAEARERRALLAEARERERQRIARDLHDGPIQNLYGVGHDLDRLTLRAAKGPAPPASPDDVQRVRDRVTAIASELREVLSTLRPAHLDHLGLAAALRGLADRTARRNPLLRIEIDLASDGRGLSAEAQHALYRVAQEGLANILRHAQAQSVTLALRDTPGTTTLVLTDDGVGFAVPEQLVELARAERYGLVGATERVELVGGTLRLASRPGLGTRVEAAVPRPDAA